MKITSSYASGMNFEHNKKLQTAAAEKAGGKFDRVNISSHNTHGKDETSSGTSVGRFRALLAAEVKAGADDKKIADIKKEVALGNYDINPADTVRKMLGF